MVYNTQNHWASEPYPPSGILENTTFRKISLFLSSDEEGHLLCLVVQ
jgi:hypothetical protein